jgi:hypothetical protein
MFEVLCFTVVSVAWVALIVVGARLAAPRFDV